MPRLDWTWEEIILTKDFYVSTDALAGGSIRGNTSPKISQLSAQLRKLNASTLERQDERYRNPDSVYFKLTNLRTVQNWKTTDAN